MTPRQKQRLYFILLATLPVFLVCFMVIYAFSYNFNHFYSPEEIQKGLVADNTTIRVGGLVLKGSIERDSAPDSLKLSFVITDTKANLTVNYTGILPDLFREGQGIIATGTLQQGRFVASEILAKHDENYMPPEVQKMLDESGYQHQPQYK